MRTSTRAGIAAAVAAGLAVAVLALWNPPATAGGGAETGRIEPASMSVGGGGTDQGSVPPQAPWRGPAPDVPALPEPIAPVPPPVTDPASPDPNGSVSSPALPYDPGYWTPERMASAKPMPMPSPG
jgi:hypothetical protein